jgi:hypothetical protein
MTFPTSVVSSVVSKWPAHYQNEGGMGAAYARGLRWQDITMKNEEGPGVCFVRPPNIPQSREESEKIQEKIRNIQYIEELLRGMGVDEAADRRDAKKQVRGLSRSASDSTCSGGLQPWERQERLAPKASIIASRKYRTLVLAPPRSPRGKTLAAAQAVASGADAAATLAAGQRARRLEKLRQRRLPENVAPPTGAVLCGVAV